VEPAQPHPFPLEVEDLTLTRGGRIVLEVVSARFERGAVTAVVGPSGAGKSSLLRCLNRLEQPDAGRILLDGQDVSSIDPTLVRRKVGMIFQTPVLFEGGVRANLGYGLDAVGDDRAAAALEAAGLPPSFLDRPSTALSVGQAQRVTIARALVREPEVLLMDEPTSALDKDAARRIETLVGDLAKRGLTVVLVTHDLSQAKRVARHALLLARGRVLAAGGIDRIEAAWPREEMS